MYGQQKESRKKLKICYSLIFVVALQIVDIYAVQNTFQPIYKQDETVRNSKSKEVLKYMNLSVDPCQDFYAYACGNWNKYHDQLKENEIATSLNYLEKKVEKDLVLLLEEQVTLSDGVNGRKAKEFYKSCKQAVANSYKQQIFHSEMIKKYGGFPAAPGSNWAIHYPDYDWLQIVGQLRYQFGMNILIGVDVVINPYNPFENTIYLTEPSTILPAELCAEGTIEIEHHRKQYEHIEQEVAENLKVWLSLEQTVAEKIASDIMLFEFDLCRAMSSSATFHDSKMEQSENELLRGTLYELTHHFNDSIDFYKYITTSFSMPYAKPVTLRSKQYFQHLVHTLSIYAKATLANYIMYRALSMFSFPLKDNKQNRPNYCVQSTKRYFPQVVGSIYYNKYANTAAKFIVMEMFDKLKIAFENSLRATWIHEGTSRIGVAKLNDIVLYFSTYNEQTNLNHLKIDINNFWQNLAVVMPHIQKQQTERLLATNNLNPNNEVEAYELRMKYHKEFKRIDIGWALLQPPYLQEHYPHSMHYATIGQKLAVELATAFDDLGWSADILNLSNWDKNTMLVYKSLIECFRLQLSYYLDNNSETFTNITQLREMISLSAGVNVAFAAYLNWLDFLSPHNDFGILRKETLPELNFTNTQLFFIAYAQMNCEYKETKKTIAACCPLQGHSLERYKVNGPLWNNLEFGKEFGCAIGSDMNSAEKCIIY